MHWNFSMKSSKLIKLDLSHNVTNYGNVANQELINFREYWKKKDSKFSPYKDIFVFEFACIVLKFVLCWKCIVFKIISKIVKLNKWSFLRETGLTQTIHNTSKQVS